MEEIKAEVDSANCELIRGGGGIFDVKVGDKLIYSKQSNGNQFPGSGEVVEILKQLSD